MNLDIFRTLVMAAQNDDLCLVEVHTDAGTPTHIVCAQSKNRITEQTEYTPLAQLIEGGGWEQRFTFEHPLRIC